MIRAIAAVLVAAVSASVLAQAPAPTRIPGTVEKSDGNLLTVKARGGEVMKVMLDEKTIVVGLTKASINDIAKDKFIGTTTVGERNGALVALEVHIFPEA